MQSKKSINLSDFFGNMVKGEKLLILELDVFRTTLNTVGIWSTQYNYKKKDSR